MTARVTHHVAHVGVRKAGARLRAEARTASNLVAGGARDPDVGEYQRPSDAPPHPFVHGGSQSQFRVGQAVEYEGAGGARREATVVHVDQQAQPVSYTVRFADGGPERATEGARLRPAQQWAQPAAGGPSQGWTHPQLNGACAGGACVCDAGWKGANCSQLDLGESRVAYDGMQPDTAAWGGSAVAGDDGVWHGFFAEITNHCTLSRG
eukprot:gene9220-6923_t